MSKNYQMTENQIYVMNCTETLPVHLLKQAHTVRHLYGLYQHNEM
jgi:hypothetical protein